MRTAILSIFLGLFFQQLVADEPDAIIHYDTEQIVIYSPSKITYRSSSLITIFSSEGNFLANSSFDEDHHTTMRSIEVIVKNAKGELLGRFDKKDFKEEAALTYRHIYDDIRIFELDYAQNEFPYTIEVNSLMESSFFMTESYVFWEYEDVKTDSSSFELFYPVDFEISKVIENGEFIRVDSVSDDKLHHYRYTSTANQYVEYEPYQNASRYPRITFIPKKFEFAGEIGSFESWKDYGEFYYALAEGRRELPEDAMLEIDNVIAGLNMDEEKAQAIYQYVQDKMRYVFIGFGNGGYQTMKAKDCYKLGYGDCKGLTNFTQSAMTYAGIEAYPALISAGSNAIRINPDIPKHSFNHMILCLPTIADTTWLECTSKDEPFGYLGDFTDNRYALVIKHGDSQLVRTDVYSKSENRVERNFVIELQQTGEANIKMKGFFQNQGLDQSVFYHKKWAYDKDIDAVEDALALKSFDLISLETELYPDNLPMLNVSVDADARLFARRVGSKLMLKPLIGEIATPYLDIEDERTTPVFIRRGVTFVDSVEVILPEGYVIKDIPEQDVIETPFGTCTYQVSKPFENENLQVIRKVVLFEGEFSVEQYQDLCEFYDRVDALRETYLIVQKL